MKAQILYISDDFLNSSFDENRKHRSPSHRLSILHKLRSSRVSLSKLKKSIKKEKDLTEEFNQNNNNNNYSRENVTKLAGVLSSNWDPQKRDITVSFFYCCFMPPLKRGRGFLDFPMSIRPSEKFVTKGGKKWGICVLDTFLVFNNSVFIHLNYA